MCPRVPVGCTGSHAFLVMDLLAAYSGVESDDSSSSDEPIDAGRDAADEDASGTCMLFKKDALDLYRVRYFLVFFNGEQRASCFYRRPGSKVTGAYYFHTLGLLCPTYVCFNCFFFCTSPMIRSVSGRPLSV